MRRSRYPSWCVFSAAVTLLAATLSSCGMPANPLSESQEDPAGAAVLSGSTIRMGTIRERFHENGQWEVHLDSVTRFRATGAWELSIAESESILCVTVEESEIGGLVAESEVCREIEFVEPGESIRMGLLLETDRIIEVPLVRE